MEVERLANAAGIITLGNQVIQAGSPLAGQRARIRLDGQIMHVIIQDGIPGRLPCPIPPASGTACRASVWPDPSRCQLQAWSSSGRCAAAAASGSPASASRLASATPEDCHHRTGDTTLRIIDQHGELITTVPSASDGEISRFKAYGTRRKSQAP